MSFTSAVGILFQVLNDGLKKEISTDRYVFILFFKS